MVHSKNRLMILGAGRGQVDLIRTAKQMGYHTIIASIQGNYPGFQLADEICYVNITDPKAVSEAAAQCHADGIATACMDTGITALGYACDQNHLIGVPGAAAEMSQNKLLMKSALMENGVNTARYKKVCSRDELEIIIQELNFPLIIKAVDLQGSRGINIVYDVTELYAGYDRTMSETHKDYCIVEEFIEGYEFGAQAFIYNGEVLYILPCGDITYRGNTNIPVGHYAPLDADEAFLEKTREQVVKAIHALGLNNCAVNVDLIMKDGEIYIIELTGRIGANCLSQLTSIYYGMDVNRLIVDTAMGNDPRAYFNQAEKKAVASYAQMLISETTGRLVRIVDTNPPADDIYEITYFVKEGDTIRKFTNSTDCIGQVVVKGASLEDCRRRIDEVIANIHFELE